MTEQIHHQPDERTQQTDDKPTPIRGIGGHRLDHILHRRLRCGRYLSVDGIAAIGAKGTLPHVFSARWTKTHPFNLLFCNYICITDKCQYLYHRYCIIKKEVIREDRDIRQKDIAAVLNVSQNTYSQYETGVISLTAEVLVKLADYYDVSVDYLLDRTNTPTMQK